MSSPATRGSGRTGWSPGFLVKLVLIALVDALGAYAVLAAWGAESWGLLAATVQVLLEGTPAQMWSSLLKLRALPDTTRVYCGHEYTQANARFALTVDGANPVLQAYAEDVDDARESGAATIPAQLGREKRANPFLRADKPELQAVLGMAGADPVAVFAEIRGRKDRF